MIDSDGRPALGAGDSGEWVLDLQHRLQTLGLYLGTLDGEFGERTATAVHEFALVYHVTPDSEPDPHVLVGPRIWTGVLAHTENIWAAAQETADLTGAAAAGHDVHAYGSGDQQGPDWVWHEGTWHPAGAVPETHAVAEHVTPDGHWRWVDGQWQPNT